MNEVQKINIFKQIKKLVGTSGYGMCTLLGHVYYSSDEITAVDIEELRYILQQQKGLCDLDRDAAQGYWFRFDEQGRQKRIKVLNNIIEQLESEL